MSLSWLHFRWSGLSKSLKKKSELLASFSKLRKYGTVWRYRSPFLVILSLPVKATRHRKSFLFFFRNLLWSCHASLLRANLPIVNENWFVWGLFRTGSGRSTTNGKGGVLSYCLTVFTYLVFRNLLKDSIVLESNDGLLINNHICQVGMNPSW